jgi:hypothetical protein
MLGKRPAKAGLFCDILTTPALGRVCSSFLQAEKRFCWGSRSVEAGFGLWPEAAGGLAVTMSYINSLKRSRWQRWVSIFAGWRARLT